MKRRVSLLLAVLLVTGCQNLDGKINQLRKLEEETYIQVKTVQAYTVAASREGIRLEVAGVVTPRRELPLSFGTAGKIARMYVEKGEAVAAGQTLATLEAEVWQQGVRAAEGQIASAAIRRSQALQGAERHEIETQRLQVEKARQTAEKAEQEHQRAQTLYANGAISRDELEGAALAQQQAALSLREQEVAYDRLLQGTDQLDVEAANAVVEEAQLQLDRARQEASAAVLKAPFSGVVAAIGQREAEQTGPGAEVIRLVDTSQWLVQLQLDSEQVASWQQGAVVTVRAADGTEAEGKVSFISPVVDPATGAFPVEVTVTDSTLNWRGGMTVSCEYTLQKDDALLVPVTSVGVSEEGYYVMRIGETAVQKVPVQVGALHGAYYEIVDGLQQGDVIVRSGLSYVVDGEAVNVHHD
ncbi:efflux RND transporter periplasmic adaptor subunit [Brevibacillus sp. TJ4]|uniref:efflux RND transporter periplasmic adaptor subunit n=1 Tax=Brevibacillus sp. TJ4 TaxID=3234853 RepID=UPI0037CF552A